MSVRAALATYPINGSMNTIRRVTGFANGCFTVRSSPAVRHRRQAPDAMTEGALASVTRCLPRSTQENHRRSVGPMALNTLDQQPVGNGLTRGVSIITLLYSNRSRAPIPLPLHRDGTGNFGDESVRLGGAQILASNVLAVHTLATHRRYTRLTFQCTQGQFGLAQRPSPARHFTPRSPQHRGPTWPNCDRLW